MRKYVSLLYSVVAAALLAGCGSPDIAMKKGDKLYAMGEYYNAADQYKKAYAKTPVKDKPTRGQRALKPVATEERQLPRSREVVPSATRQRSTVATRHQRYGVCTHGSRMASARFKVHYQAAGAVQLTALRLLTYAGWR